MIRFIEVVNQTDWNPRMERVATPQYTLAEIWINPHYVINIREARGYKSLLSEGFLPADLEDGHSFTLVTTNEGEGVVTHVVMGSPTAVATRLEYREGPELLKG